jgi:hypothetical protein
LEKPREAKPLERVIEKPKEVKPSERHKESRNPHLQKRRIKKYEEM